MTLGRNLARRLWTRLSRRSQRKPASGSPEKTQSQQAESPTAETLEAKPQNSIDKVYQLLQRHHASFEDHDRKVNDNLKTSSRQIHQILESALPTIPTETRQLLTAIGRLDGGHRKLINVFAEQDYEEKLTYVELADKMGVATATVRVYVSDLKRLGFPFVEGKIGKKMLVGIKKEVLLHLLGENPTPCLSVTMHKNQNGRKWSDSVDSNDL